MKGDENVFNYFDPPYPILSNFAEQTCWGARKGFVCHVAERKNIVSSMVSELAQSDTVKTTSVRQTQSNNVAKNPDPPQKRTHPSQPLENQMQTETLALTTSLNPKTGDGFSPRSRVLKGRSCFQVFGTGLLAESKAKQEALSGVFTKRPALWLCFVFFAKSFSRFGYGSLSLDSFNDIHSEAGPKTKR